jgi:hypothetical protein
VTLSRRNRSHRGPGLQAFGCQRNWCRPGLFLKQLACIQSWACFPIIACKPKALPCPAARPVEGNKRFQVNFASVCDARAMDEFVGVIQEAYGGGTKYDATTLMLSLAKKQYCPRRCRCWPGRVRGAGSCVPAFMITRPAYWISPSAAFDPSTYYATSRHATNLDFFPVQIL